MPAIRRILVPVDFSHHSELALDYAVDLARGLGASIVLVHAYDVPTYGPSDPSAEATTELAGRLSSTAQRLLDSWVTARRASGVQVEGVLRRGVAWEEIAGVAQRVGADLIVLGTRGRRGLARAILGSVAESVIRSSDVPVLTIREPSCP